MIKLILLLMGSFLLQNVNATRWKNEKCSLSYYAVGLPSCSQQLLEQNIYQAGYFPADDSTHFAHLKRKAKWVKWLGISSLISLIVPVVQLLSIPAAIVSLVMGGHVKRQTTDEGLLKDVSTGRKFSIATITVVVIAAILAILIVLLVIAFFRTFFNWR